MKKIFIEMKESWVVFFLIFLKRSDTRYACSLRNIIVVTSVYFIYLPEILYVPLPTSSFIAGQTSIFAKSQHKGNRPQFPKITI